MTIQSVEQQLIYHIVLKHSTMKNVSFILILVLIICLSSSCNRPVEKQPSPGTYPVGSKSHQLAPQESRPDTVAHFDTSKQKVACVLKYDPPVPPPPLPHLAVDSFEGYDVFFQQFDKAPDVFTISNSTDTTIICQEGISIKIPANSFVLAESGDSVSGPIEIRAKEFYSIPDILMAALTTTSGDKMLETGGMIHIEAFSENQKLDLATGKSIDIGFPYEEKKEGMELFTGDRNDDGVMDWSQAIQIESEIPQGSEPVQTVTPGPPKELLMSNIL